MEKIFFIEHEGVAYNINQISKIERDGSLLNYTFTLVDGRKITKNIGSMGQLLERIEVLDYKLGFFKG